MTTTTEQQERIERLFLQLGFWDWFEAHDEEMRQLLDQDNLPQGPNPDSLWTELHAQLHAVHSDLRLTMVRDPDGPIVLLSAVGCLANIPLVHRALMLAPTKTWRVAAFREPCYSLSGFFHLADDLPIDDVGFSIIATSAGLRLVIYTRDDPGAEPCVQSWAEMMLRVMYDRTVVNQFTEVIWRQAPTEFREEQVYRLNELLEVMDGLTKTVQDWERKESVHVSRG